MKSLDKQSVYISKKYLPAYLGNTVMRGRVFFKEFEKGKKRVIVPYFLIGTHDNPMSVFLLTRSKEIGEQKGMWVAITYAPIYHVGGTRVIEWDKGLHNYFLVLEKLKKG